MRIIRRGEKARWDKDTQDQPPGARRSSIGNPPHRPVPLPKEDPKGKPQETSIDVLDWTSGERLWSASLLDKKLNSNQAQMAPGPTIEIHAHGMTSDQLALKITDTLRRYVAQLEGSPTH